MKQNSNLIHYDYGPYKSPCLHGKHQKGPKNSKGLTGENKDNIFTTNRKTMVWSLNGAKHLGQHPNAPFTIQMTVVSPKSQRLNKIISAAWSFFSILSTKLYPVHVF